MHREVWRWSKYRGPIAAVLGSCGRRKILKYLREDLSVRPGVLMVCPGCRRTGACSLQCSMQSASHPHVPGRRMIAQSRAPTEAAAWPSFPPASRTHRPAPQSVRRLPAASAPALHTSQRPDTGSQSSSVGALLGTWVLRSSQQTEAATPNSSIRPPQGRRHCVVAPPSSFPKPAD